MRRRLRNSYAQLPYLVRSLRFVWAAAGPWTIAWVALLILQGVLPVLSVYLTRFLINQLVTATESGLSWESVRTVLLPVILMAVVLLLSTLLTSLSNWIRTAQSERVQDYMSALIHQKSYTVDLALYDSADFYDHLHRARSDATYRPISLLEGLGSLIQNGVTMVSMTILLFQFGAWMPIALLISTVPVIFVVFRYRERLYTWRIRNTAAERKVWYYEWLLIERETAAELRLFQLGGHFSQRFQELRSRLRQERTGMARDQALAELAAGSLALVVTGASMAWMLIQTIAGRYNLGDMAFFYQAFIQGQGLARSFLDDVGEIYTNSLFLSDLFEFLSLEPAVADPPDPQPMPDSLVEGIRFEDVTFSYPGSQRQALGTFNLFIPAGRFVAIVGPNGAGKSTLIRLLCRFYDPQSGRITLDGVDLRQLRVSELHRTITVLFQQPVQYFGTARENIQLGDMASQPDMERIIAAAKDAGADEPIMRLPQGYETLLGKWFENGADLSVGEWQRLALARAFLRQAGLLILDEPTSAMDPWAEADWSRRFRRVASGRTAILITHRFSTAAHADIIHVMQSGQIVESGRHTDLLTTGGLYAQSWQNQMEQYAR